MQTVSPLHSAHTPPLTLIADRDGDTRKMYAQYLSIAGYRIEEAEDGREALAKAISGHPDVVVSETRLPGINGFDLCRLLRADVATRAILMVFVTGDAFSQDLTRARTAGADAVLVKPCLPERLLLELRRVLTTSDEIRERARAAAATARERAERAAALVHDARRAVRKPLSRAIPRFQTADPPVHPPALVCPHCDQPLRYDHSNVGGVSVRHIEQWDYYECSSGCGIFQYRHRTRKLRKVM